MSEGMKSGKPEEKVEEGKEMEMAREGLQLAGKVPRQ